MSDNFEINVFPKFSLDEDKDVWEEVYNLSEGEVYGYSGLMDYNEISPEPREQKIYDLNTFDFPSTFVSIDFENLFPQRVSACSVGMVKYKEGKIDDKFYSLIRPPFEYEGKCGPALTWIHGFTESSFDGKPTFDEILPKMEDFIEGLPLVAHNACVERACIHDACEYYNIDTSIPYNEIIDTYLLSKVIEERLGMNVSGAGSHSLNVVCQRFGVKELRHHHACDDAEMCGNLFLVFPQFLSGQLEFDESAWKKATEFCKSEIKSNNFIYQSFASQGHIALNGNVLQKDLTGADPSNPFYDRKVVITGVFNIERDELARKLKSMGADIDTCVGSKTNYLLVGNDPGPSKIRKFDELIAQSKDVRKIYQEDLDLILTGNEYYYMYHTDLPITKKEKKVQERKTTWPNLVEKFKLFINGDNVEFTERETQSEDYKLLSLYYKQQQKIPTTKMTVLENLRQLDEAKECEFRKDILACFVEGEDLTKEQACKRMQIIFSKYGLLFKAKACVLTEFGFVFKEYKANNLLHLLIIQKPQS